MKIIIFLLSLTAFLLVTGCASQVTIPLNDEAQIVQLMRSETSVLSVKKRLQPAELVIIEREIFVWLLTHVVDNDSRYSAVFLQTDEAATVSLLKQFPNHIPSIKQLWHLETRPGQSPLDKDTSRPAILLSTDVMEPENGTIDALGKWFAGDAEAGFRTFELGKNGGKWKIQSVK